jgi:hypothetical protein
MSLRHANLTEVKSRLARAAKPRRRRCDERAWHGVRSAGRIVYALSSEELHMPAQSCPPINAMIGSG